MERSQELYQHPSPSEKSIEGCSGEVTLHQVACHFHLLYFWRSDNRRSWQGHLKVEAFYRSRPVFRVSPQATHEKQEKRVFARTPRAPTRGLLPLATPLSRLLNRPEIVGKRLVIGQKICYHTIV